MPMTLSFMNGAIPIVLRKIIAFEQYQQGRSEVQVALVRVFILRLINLYTLMYTLYEKVNNTSDECSGTLIGQALYKLVVFDTIVQLSMRATMLSFWNNWHNRKVDLNMSEGVLAMSYRQGLVWAGMCFCPVLPIAGTISHAATMLVYYHVTLRVCRPPMKRWNQGRYNIAFFMLLLGNLVFVAVPVFYFLSTYQPTCGPYAESGINFLAPPMHDLPVDYPFVFLLCSQICDTLDLCLACAGSPLEVFSDVVYGGPTLVSTTARIVTSPWTLMGVISLLCVLVYVVHVRLRVAHIAQDELLLRLQREKDDKTYLLQLMKEEQLARLVALTEN
jgi:hypothetical protein